MSVLYVCHGHPQLARGGGELAAWRLFEHFNSLDGYGHCGFLAAAPTQRCLPPGCEVMGMAERQWLIKPSANAVIHDTAVSLRDGQDLHRALIGLAPRLIHLHHYLHVGVDLLPALKRWFPGVPVILTLHEYSGMCVYVGRLLRRSGELCEGGDPESCNTCLGGEQRDQLAIRALRMQRFFAAVDHFLAPSYFLKRQYLRWGVAPQKISVIENLPPPKSPGSALPRKKSGGASLIVGYFGQINPWKGLDLILEAVVIARAAGADVCLEIHGLDPDELAQRERRDCDAFWLRCSEWLAALQPNGAVVMGRYRSDELNERMSGLDVMVMGSCWFENSPMVIQEAFQHSLPVLAPRLGGMAEKVRDDSNGLLFESGDPRALAAVLQRFSEDQGLRSQLALGATKAAERGSRAALQHERLYARFTQKEKSV